MGSQPDNPLPVLKLSFDVVYELGAPFLRALLRRSDIARQDREDVLHAILLAAYRGLEGFDTSRLQRAAQAAHEEGDEQGPPGDAPAGASGASGASEARSRRAWGPLYRWLNGIAWRQVSHYRNRAYRRREIPMGLYGSAIFASVDTRPRLEEQAEQAERAERTDVVDSLLASLIPERRVMLVMHDMLEISVVDIARELKINENTAQNRLRLAREDFRAAVKRLAPEQRGALRLGDRPFAGEATARRRPAPGRRGT